MKFSPHSTEYVPYFISGYFGRVKSKFEGKNTKVVYMGDFTSIFKVSYDKKGFQIFNIIQLLSVLSIHQTLAAAHHQKRRKLRVTKMTNDKVEIF